MKRFDRANLLICQWIGLAAALTALILCGRSIVSVVILVIMAVFMAAISPVNAENADEFIKGKDRYGNPVKVKKILAQSCYVVYLNPADDAEQNEIVFKMKRTAA